MNRKLKGALIAGGAIFLVNRGGDDTANAANAPADVMRALMAAPDTDAE